MIGRFILQLLRFGIAPKDNQNIRAQKKALNYMLITISIAGILWGFMYISLGFYISSIFPFAFPVVLAIFLSQYKKNKRFDYAVNVLLWGIYLLPLFLQLSIGNITDSGAVIAWSFCAPIGALLFKSSEIAIKWFLAFLFSIIAIAGIQVFSPYTIYTPSYWIIFLFFIMNIGVVLIISFTAVIYFSKQLKASNIKVVKKTRELKDSIETASIIQKAIIGDPRTIPASKEDRSFFIFCQPKDIVCGDFLWSNSVGSKQLFIVADSTHNGVPGALITLLGNNALNDIILNKNELNPAKIIDEFLLYFKIDSSIQGAAFTKDIFSKKLINIGVLVLENETKTITYAGLNNTAVHLIRDDKNPDKNQFYEFIGDDEDSMLDKTSLFNLQFVPDSMIYLSTNGFEKQLDAKGIRTFKHKKFCDLLTRIAPLDFPLQEKSLEDRLQEWRKDQPLTEDVLVLGVRI